VSAYETLGYEEDGGVAWVTLDRPDVHNAFDSRMQTELRDVWRSLRRNDDVRCVVLTGAGDRAFCTGIDRTETMGTGEARARPVGSGTTPFMFDDPGEDIGPKTNDLWKPVIAAVNGMACGGAFYMLGEVDFIIAVESATFFDPHVTYGMTASFEPIHMLQKMPFHEIMRLSLLGNWERMSAARAHQIGLVSELASDLDDLRAKAAWAAGAIASAPPLAIQGTLRAVWMGLERTRSQALAEAYAYIGLGTNQESIRQGQERFATGERIDWRLR
jgi:enoyl-CoA hydratase/carnithine racemase